MRERATGAATPRGKAFPPASWLPETPVRERGAPPRSHASLRDSGPPVNARKEVGRRGGTQVAASPPLTRWTRVSLLQGGGLGTRYPDEEEDDISCFWGQLWFVPSTTPKPTKARVLDKGRESLVWIHKDLWEERSFEVIDCYPVGEGDSWTKPPSKLNFAEDIWGKGRKKSFSKVLKEAMAGRGRGHGPRPRSAEED